MQPILLMKQTLQVSYDPGALLLSGSNLKFTSSEQLFSQNPPQGRVKQFKLGLEVNSEENITCTFQKRPKKAIELHLMEYAVENHYLKFTADIEHEDLLRMLPNNIRSFYKETIERISIESVSSSLSQEVESSALEHHLKRAVSSQMPLKLKVLRDRCFFEIFLYDEKTKSGLAILPFSPANSFEEFIREVIHVPGLRGNPERNYKTTAVGGEFPGTFENYVASVVNHWQLAKNKKLNDLKRTLQILGLTSKIESRPIDDTQVELRVGRLPCSSNKKAAKSDMVSIADVGFGVSQTLPVLVALLVANPGQLVYIEQPEIHLHPRAQVALAEAFVEAANRGVRVVVETHSESFLLGIQSFVAEGKLLPDKVKLHWFTRQDDGATKVATSNLDETGAFGDWPEDFGEVALAIQNRYLTAAEARLWQP